MKKQRSEKDKVAFTFSFDVKESVFRRSVEGLTESLDCYDPTVRRAAGLDLKAFRENLVTDPTLRARIEKAIRKEMGENVRSVASDFWPYDVTVPGMAAIEKKLEKAEEASRREDRAKDAVELLKELGYTVSKTKQPALKRKARNRYVPS